MAKKNHHLIFEGAELVGKSNLMAQIYDYLEKKYNQDKVTLDGCHWFNSDVGIFGSTLGKPCIEKYLDMLKILEEKNVMFEKFHISDIVYNRIHHNIELDYSSVEKKLKKLQTKIILCTYEENEELISKRIKDRLNLYPHYKRILKSPDWYIKQQKEYIEEVKKSLLPYLIVDLTQIPNDKGKEILKWINEI